MNTKKQIRENFRTQVFTRDKYKCVFCDKTDNLDAHHITDRNSKEIEKGGYVKENGISLCSEHHLIAENFHDTEGKEWEEGFHPDDLYKKINSSKELAIKKAVYYNCFFYYKKLIYKYMKHLLLFESFCDGCKYFDMNNIRRFYPAYENPVYSLLWKRTTEELIFINPKQYIYTVARNFGNLSYDDALMPVSDELVDKYVNAMKNGDKFPVGHYTNDRPDQEGRHRAVAMMKLGVDKKSQS